MIKLNIHEAKTHLSHHLERLVAGREDVILICKRNVPIAEIRALPARPKTRRPLGLGRGKATIPASFFDELPDDLIAAFSGEEP